MEVEKQTYKITEFKINLNEENKKIIENKNEINENSNKKYKISEFHMKNSEENEQI